MQAQNRADSSRDRAATPLAARAARSKLSEDFWRDMHDAWQEGGKDAVKAMMLEEPGRFVDCVARALPKDVNVKHESTDAFLQLWKLISDGQAEAALAAAKQGEEEPV